MLVSSNIYADGGSVHSCWHRLDIDGDDTYHHSVAVLLALQAEDYLACYSWSSYISSGCKLFLLEIVVINLDAKHDAAACGGNQIG